MKSYTIITNDNKTTRKELRVKNQVYDKHNQTVKREKKSHKK